MATQVLPCVVSLGVCTCLHPQYVDSRCTWLRQQEEVNVRLRSCRDGSVGVWSQFSWLTGSVLWDLPPGLRQAVSGAQVVTLYHTSLSTLEDCWTAVDASAFSLQNVHLHNVKPSFILTSVAGGDFL